MVDHQHQVYLGIGSNINARENISHALALLASIYENLTLSPGYLSKSVGFEGPDFLNLVAGITTHDSISTLSANLKLIEKQYGREEHAVKFSSRTLDIDILAYDNLAGVYSGIELPRAEIHYNAYVLKPFSELVPDLILPGGTESLAELWANFDHNDQPLTPTDFQR